MPELFGDKAYGVFKQIDSVLILACGTSYYAGLTAKYWLESIAKIPVNVEIASEYRYRDSVPNPIRWSSPSRKVVKLQTPWLP
jgi:glucosamine--fructose-6-phosphate aminotransferase (isomerizing)